MPETPSRHREVKLVAEPTDGLPRPEHFEIVETRLPSPGDGEVLVHNRYFLISASLRMMIGEGAEVIKGVPFPPVQVGDTLGGAALGEIVSAPAESGFSPGDLVQHFFGWRDYATVPVALCQRVADALPDPVAHLGHGWTAYAALTRGVQVRPGDTVFVSSGASAIGSMAGQIARLLGAGRVIGSTSSQEKADLLVSELGYDAAVIRGAGPMADQLAKAAPEGLDVFLDNVGGEQLQAAVSVAREGARVVLIGTLSGELAPHGNRRVAPVELDSFELLTKRISMCGYSACGNDADVRSEWDQRFAGWLKSGAIRFPHVLIDGLEAAPGALQDVIAGRYFGTVIVEL